MSFIFVATKTIYSDFGAWENKACHCSHCFPIYLPWSNGTRCHDLCFLNVEFKVSFSLFSFFLIKKLFRVPFHFLPLGWYHLHIWGYISPSYLDSSLLFIQFSISMMYSACKLNKQDDNIQPWHTPFSIWNQSAVPCPVLTVASWPAHRFLRRQARWSGITISLRIFYSLLWSTKKF